MEELDLNTYLLVGEVEIIKVKRNLRNRIY